MASMLRLAGALGRSAARSRFTAANTIRAVPLVRIFSSSVYVPSGALLSAPLDSFVPRHIGPSTVETQEMLYELGLSHLDQLVEKAIPQALLSTNFPTTPARGETEVLGKLKQIAKENELYRSYIGCGYYNCITPPVILRNVLENPGWYTPYTPYQAEISQGRLEALLNYQTMVADLTGMKYSNASLLDEATAAAEAMSVCMALSPVKERNFLVSQTCHPQIIDVLRTRARGLGINLIVSNAENFDLERTPVKGLLLQYPDTTGEITDYSPLLRAAKEAGSLSVMCCDLLASAILMPPGDLGADIAVGSAQRFGVPLGAGGPHAAFFATNNEKVLRKMPGRIVGVSVDRDGNPAVRLALQSREQHIRREKATSNICTAQALLANIAGMFAVYHGPEGLRLIAERVHMLTCVLAEGLRRLGYTVRNNLFFDTLTVKAPHKSAHLIYADAQARRINLRILDSKHVGISLDETTTTADLAELFEVFAEEPLTFSPESLASEVHDLIDMSHLSRTSEYLTHPIFEQCRSEHEMLRYLHRLARKDLSLTTSMMPLGSCTMKLNATSEMLPVTWDNIAHVHPFVPLSQMAGYHQIFADLDRILCEITGFAEISFQPNSGAQGEYAGLSVIREYHKNMGEEQRDVCLIPASAHGTNPASAIMAGMKVVVIRCDADGYLDISHLMEMAEKHSSRLAAMMITYPSTYGVFEETIQGACAIVHQYGGQVYLDGANMNAMVGLVRPAELGADVCHLNLHKTFCIPHGGGGPGMGPIGVADHLTPYLPNHHATVTGGRTSIGPVAAAPFSSASILPITWMYLNMLGMDGLALASKVAILNANYMRKRLEHAYHIRYTSNTGYCAHEFIIDVKPFKESANIEVDDIAKRLMDYNFHAGTVSWPVPNSMMIEPTESESKEEIDRFIDALLKIREEIRDIEEGRQPKEGNVLKNAPHTQFVATADKWDLPYSRQEAAYPLPWVRENKHWPAVGRVQSAYGDRHLVCSCPPIEAYEEPQ